MKKYTFLFLIFCIFSCNKKNTDTFTPTVYIIAGKSNTASWGLSKSKSLILDLEKSRQ